MSERLGMVQLAPTGNPYLGGSPMFTGEKSFSDATARLIDAEVQRIISECHEEAKQLLQQHRAQLESLVAALLANETLDEPQILEATGLTPYPHAERPQTSIAG